MSTTVRCDGMVYPPSTVEGTLRSRIDAIADAASGTYGRGPVDVSRLPGTARILLIPAQTRVSARIRNRHYDRLPDIAIVGPSSRPVALRVDGPAPVEIPISPLDWSRLTAVSALTVSDRIVGTRDLGIGCLDGSVGSDTIDARGAVARLAEAIVERGSLRSDEDATALIARLMALIDEGTVFDAATAATDLSTSPHNLRRIALRWFGFPPKTLLMRRRFIAALERFEETGMDFASITAFSYFDASHFLRDANRFLGTTPRRYLRRIGRSCDRPSACPTVG